MTIAECDPTTEVWEWSPQQDPGAEPWSGGAGGEAPLKHSVFQKCKWGTNLPTFYYLANCSNMLFERTLLHCC